MRHPQLDKILAHLKHYLVEEYGERLDRVVLFGSQARGDARADSERLEHYWLAASGLVSAPVQYPAFVCPSTALYSRLPDKPILYSVYPASHQFNGIGVEILLLLNNISPLQSFKRGLHAICAEISLFNKLHLS